MLIRVSGIIFVKFQVTIIFTICIISRLLASQQDEPRSKLLLTKILHALCIHFLESRAL